MYEKLPEQLKKDGRFCLWKYEERNGRMTKVPYQTNGRKASSADKNTFSDLCPVIFIMDNVGTPAKNIFVAHDLRAVCAVTSELNFTVLLRVIVPRVSVTITSRSNPDFITTSPM